MTEQELNEIAEEFANPVVRTIRFVVALMLFVSVLVLLFGSAIAFQRLGSLWVAIIVIVFGFTRHVIHGLQSLIANPELTSEFTFHGSSNPLVRWSKPTETSLKQLRTNSGRDDLRKLIEGVDARLTSRAYPLELFWLALATLQWGYGDLFHCFVNGNGWTTC